MALSYNIVERGAFGQMFIRIVDITMDNSYPSGGWALSPASMGFGTNGTILAVVPFNDISGRFPFWDRTNNKLMIRDASGAANAASPEITTVAQMNSIVLRVLAYGKGQG